MRTTVLRSTLVGILVLGVFIGILSGVERLEKRPAPVFAAGSTSFNAHLPLLTRSSLSTIFGAEFLRITESQGFEQMVQANAYWVRRNGVPWSELQPQEGVSPDWSQIADLEDELKRVASRGLQTILVVRNTPTWAQAVEGTLCGAIKEEKFDAFGDFMFQLVQRYRRAPYFVKYWEIWNEPDIDPDLVAPDNWWGGCWGDQGDPYYGGEYYARMLRAVYPRIKEADPQAKVLVGGLLLDCDPRPTPGQCSSSNFFEGVLLEGKDYFDGVSFHAYDFYLHGLNRYGNQNWNSGYSPEGDSQMMPVLEAKVSFLREKLAAYNAEDKFLVNTESALLCNPLPGDSGCESEPYSDFERTKAYYLTQSYGSALAEGLLANIWYTPMGWRNSGLLYSDRTPRPAYQAFKFSRQMLRDAVFVRKITEYEGVIGYEFDRGDRRIWLLWSRDGLWRIVTLQETMKPLAARDSLGEPVVIVENGIPISMNPLYLEWEP